MTKINKDTISKNYEDIINKIQDNLCALRDVYDNDEIIELYEQKILDLNNADLSYWFAFLFSGANVEAHQHVVFCSKDPRTNLAFLEHVTGARGLSDYHEQIILNSKDVGLCYQAARDDYHSRIMFGKVILESKDPMHNYLMTLLPGTNVKAHARVVIESKDPELNYNCIMYSKYEDISLRKEHGKVINEFRAFAKEHEKDGLSNEELLAQWKNKNSKNNDKLPTSDLNSSVLKEESKEDINESIAYLRRLEELNDSMVEMISKVPKKVLSWENMPF